MSFDDITITHALTSEVFYAVMATDEFTEGEKLVLKWQYGLTGDFNRSLFELMTKADSNNLDKIEQSFPYEVSGFRSWKDGDLMIRFSEVSKRMYTRIYGDA